MVFLLECVLSLRDICCEWCRELEIVYVIGVTYKVHLARKRSKVLIKYCPYSDFPNVQPVSDHFFPPFP